MQAAGEQQQRQYAIEEEMRQVGRIKRAAKPVHDVEMQHMIAGNDQSRDDQRTQQHADRGRQVHPHGVDAADERRQHEDDGEEIDRLHRSLSVRRRLAKKMSAKPPRRNGFGEVLMAAFCVRESGQRPVWRSI